MELSNQNSLPKQDTSSLSSLKCISCNKELPIESFSRRQIFKQPNCKCEICVNSLLSSRVKKEEKEEKVHFTLEKINSCPMKVLPCRIPGIKRFKLPTKMIIPCNTCTNKNKENPPIHYAWSVTVDENNQIYCNNCFFDMLENYTNKHKEEFDHHDDFNKKPKYQDAGYQETSSLEPENPDL